MAGARVGAAGPSFVCPRCRGPLSHRDEAYRCDACAQDYPVLLGIPDFRLFPDPWIGLVEDREKGTRLEAATAGLGFAATVRAYWAMTEGTPRTWAERFTERAIAAEERAVDWIEAGVPEDRLPTGATLLDIGCGTGGLLAAVAGRGGRAIGVDIAFRWLVVARRRPAIAAGGALLVCANGEHLPFAAASAESVAIAGTLEHCREAGAVVREGRRVLRSGGSLRIRTVNRYSLLREPHVGVWGVGFVPRRWADAFVRWRSGQGYIHHRPLSFREVAGALKSAGFDRVRVAAAPLLASDRRHLRGVMGWAARAYARLRSLPLVGTGLAWVAPELEARGVAP